MKPSRDDFDPAGWWFGEVLAVALAATVLYAGPVLLRSPSPAGSGTSAPPVFDHVVEFGARGALWIDGEASALESLEALAASTDPHDDLGPGPGVTLVAVCLVARTESANYRWSLEVRKQLERTGCAVFEVLNAEISAID